MELNNVQQTDFDAYVHAIFQSEGNILKDSARERLNVIGNTEQFRKSNQVVATQKAPQDALTVLNMRFDPVIATLTNWSAPDFVNIFEETDVNFNAGREVAEGVARAINRRQDQMYIDALDASATTNVVAHGGTGFDFNKFQKAIELLAANAASRGMIYCAFSAAAQRQALGQEKFTSQFYVNYKPIAGGQGSNACGLDGQQIQNVHFRLIPDNMLEGGLPIAGDIRTCFMWNRDALGFASSRLAKTDMQWQGLYECWLINARIKAGAVAVDDTGIVKIEIDETV